MTRDIIKRTPVCHPWRDELCHVTDNGESTAGSPVDS